MAILVNANTRVLCQGMTGRAGSFHTARAMAYGTNVVAGVTPGKGGRQHLDRPVFDTVADAVRETGANASMVFVPPLQAAAAILESIEAGLDLVVVMTERIPVLDIVRVRRALSDTHTRLVGPNSHGVLVPGVTKLGVMATVDTRPGRIGIASRSASLASEVVAQISAAGWGQSTIVGVGGDPLHGLSLTDCVTLFDADPETDAIVVIGEMGGRSEEDLARHLTERADGKPVITLIVGRHAPERRRMGHAGTLTAHALGRVDDKIELLRGAGAHVAEDADAVAKTLAAALEV